MLQLSASLVMLNYAGEARKMGKARATFDNSWQSLAASPDDRQQRFGGMWERC